MTNLNCPPSCATGDPRTMLHTRNTDGGYRMRPIPTNVHGAIDYLFGVTAFVLPELTGIAEVSPAATFIARSIGAATLLLAFLTIYELGAIRVITMRAHLVIDTVLAAGLAVTPFILGVFALPMDFWLPFVALGIAGLAVVALSERNARPEWVAAKAFGTHSHPRSV